MYNIGKLKYINLFGIKMYFLFLQKTLLRFLSTRDFTNWYFRFGEGLTLVYYNKIFAVNRTGMNIYICMYIVIIKNNNKHKVATI